MTTMATITRLVPRLGWSRMSPTTPPRTPTTGQRVRRVSSISRHRWARRSATKRMSTGLASSEGCSEIGPNTSQRWAPLTEVPTANTASRRTTTPTRATRHHRRHRRRSL